MSFSRTASSVSSLAPSRSRARIILAAIPAVVAVVVVALAHVYVAWGSTAPVFYTDEVGYIANAQLMAGIGEPRDFSASSYYIGWSVLLVPLWWITQDPQQVYIGSVALSVLCGILIVAPLTWIARWFGMSTPWAVVAASAVAVAPARLVMSNFGLAENFIALLIACAVVAAIRYSEKQSLGRAAVLAGIASYLFLTHARTAPVLIATALWIVFSSWRRWKTILVAGGVAALIAVPGFLLYRSLVPLMYEPGVDREERGFTRLFQLDPFAGLTATIGQLWYALAAWYGFAILALIVVAVRTVVEIRQRKPALATWASLVFLGILAISVVWIAAAIDRGDPRLDIYAYGRYLDSVLAILALTGIAIALTRMTRQLALVWGAVALLIAALFFIVVYRQVPSGPGTWWGPNSVPGIIQWDWPNVTSAERPPWVIATIAALLIVAAAAAATVFLSQRAATVIVASVALVAFLASGIAAEIKTIRPNFSPWYTSFTLRTDVTETLAEYPDASLSFDRVGLSDTLGGVDTVSRNAYQFWLSPRAVPVFTSEDADPETDLVISRKDWPRAGELGARLVAEDTGMFNNALWVLPGALQDEMAAAGELQ
jgi:hypothetical protein